MIPYVQCFTILNDFRQLHLTRRFVDSLNWEWDRRVSLYAGLNLMFQLMFCGSLSSECNHCLSRDQITIKCSSDLHRIRYIRYLPWKKTKTTTGNITKNPAFTAVLCFSKYISAYFRHILIRKIQKAGVKILKEQATTILLSRYLEILNFPPRFLYATIWKVIATVARTLQASISSCLRRVIGIFIYETITNKELRRRTGQIAVDVLITRSKWQEIGHTLRNANIPVVDYIMQWYVLFQDGRRMGRRWIM